MADAEDVDSGTMASAAGTAEVDTGVQVLGRRSQTVSCQRFWYLVAALVQYSVQYSGDAVSGTVASAAVAAEVAAVSAVQGFCRRSQAGSCLESTLYMSAVPGSSGEFSHLAQQKSCPSMHPWSHPWHLFRVCVSQLLHHLSWSCFSSWALRSVQYSLPVVLVAALFSYASPTVGEARVLLLLLLLWVLQLRMNFSQLKESFSGANGVVPIGSVFVSVAVAVVLGRLSKIVSDGGKGLSTSPGKQKRLRRVFVSPSDIVRNVRNVGRINGGEKGGSATCRGGRRLDSTQPCASTSSLQYALPHRTQ
jgi:hypothetical protein